MKLLEKKLVLGHNQSIKMMEEPLNFQLKAELQEL